MGDPLMTAEQDAIEHIRAGGGLIYRACLGLGLEGTFTVCASPDDPPLLVLENKIRQRACITHKPAIVVSRIGVEFPGQRVHEVQIWRRLTNPDDDPPPSEGEITENLLREVRRLKSGRAVDDLIVALISYRRSAYGGPQR